MADELSWPSAVLPRPSFEGYSLEPVDSVLRTEMESGPARQRRRYSNAPTRIPVRWRFTASQMAVFEGWFNHKAEAGAAWFEIDLLGGDGLTSHEARFFGNGNAPYKAIPHPGGKGDAGLYWMVTSTLEVRERPIMDKT